jgi:hypothetical protein
MGMQISLTQDEQGYDVINPYIRIERIDTNKDSFYVLLGFYKSQSDVGEKSPFKYYSNSFNRLDVAGNIWSQIYTGLKILPEFQDAIDII